ncbi:stage III sporulation AC/AD family protein [Papillibacter cinnamivorans]|uniref:Stage III sporulation protein AD n=1 Tax=Papillibacter cinnamivorans DSM 12816 TaxID=1122930 RepID=A0A1W2CLQ5_9FIRM|nr:stage III sporulation AC/AD family protein [Papillibacter cinnamivorans]SMC85578.1 stage III sporulation protein AD [Papillibacter cinnamivorans DSM 12816]
MEEVLKVAAIGVAGAICALVLKRNSPELGLAVTLAVGVVILLAALSVIMGIVEFIEVLADTAELDSDILAPLMKTVGIAIITKVAAEICRDAKENAIASFVETAGSAAAIFVALPLLKSVLEMITSLIS